MIINRLTREDCFQDLLRTIYNRSLIYSIIILVIGHGQSGKSTWVHYMANRLKQMKMHVEKGKKTWHEWDFQKYTTTTPEDFITLWDNSDGEVLSLEEAGEQLNYLEWYSIMAKVFTSTTNTQGLKHNICFLITPHVDDIVKHCKDKVDFMVLLHHRDDLNKRVICTPKIVGISFKTFKTRLQYVKNMYMQYDDKFLASSKMYTDHLKTYKKQIVEKNKDLVLRANMSKTERIETEVKEDIKLKVDNNIPEQPIIIRNCNTA